MPALFYMLKTIGMNKVEGKSRCHTANSSGGRATINKYNKQMSDGDVLERKKIHRRGKYCNLR